MFITILWERCSLCFHFTGEVTEEQRFRELTCVYSWAVGELGFESGHCGSRRVLPVTTVLNLMTVPCAPLDLDLLALLGKRSCGRLGEGQHWRLLNLGLVWVMPLSGQLTLRNTPHPQVCLSEEGLD